MRLHLPALAPIGGLSRTAPVASGRASPVSRGCTKTARCQKVTIAPPRRSGDGDVKRSKYPMRRQICLTSPRVRPWAPSAGRLLSLLDKGAVSDGNLATVSRQTDLRVPTDRRVEAIVRTTAAASGHRAYEKASSDWDGSAIESDASRAAMEMCCAHDGHTETLEQAIAEFDPTGVPR